MICDLHCHTKLSDGSLGIEEIIAQAKKTNIDFISITDHDTLSSFSRVSILGERYGVKVIQGVEMSAWDKERGKKVHILCYAPQKPDRLEGLCLKSCEIRKACSKEMVEKVMKLYPISLESVLKHATSSKSIFKQHIMHALIEYGYAMEFYGELNHKLFNLKNGICLVEREYPDVRFVLDLIHSARGIAVMAHPMEYDSLDLMEELAVEGKIDGVEAYHYSANEEQRKTILEIAEKYNLIVTGGSDFHGLYNSQPTHLGSNSTSKENIDRIIKLATKGKQKSIEKIDAI
ncbi:MAG: PHP domain-containing protein [Clostridiales bacterium]|jgi:predicted metal-dependent phosphoesterase TrpH|nr:PHP domain-containing protein [Clostridiales bacterium]